MLLTPVFSQCAFDGGFEDGGFVAFEVSFDAPEIGDGFVEARELLFNFRDDALLLVGRRDWNQQVPKDSLTDIRLCSTDCLCNQI